jgi:uncharacterized membrane protein
MLKKIKSHKWETFFVITFTALGITALLNGNYILAIIDALLVVMNVITIVKDKPKHAYKLSLKVTKEEAE